MKLTKAQQKRLVNDIRRKAKKLYMWGTPANMVSTKDMETIERLWTKWMNKL